MTSPGPAAEPLRLFSGLALRDALENEILPEFSKQTGIDVQTTFDPTSVLVDQIHQGNVPDVLLGVADAVHALAVAQIFRPESALSIASSAIGIAVPLGASAPKFETADMFIEFLLNAKSVAYSRSGASGIYFAALLDRLAIAQRINGHATILEKGFTAEAVVDGRADIAIQQMSELMAIPGVQVVDAFPAEFQQLTHFSAAISRRTARFASASDLIRFLTTQQSIEALRKTGLSAGE